MDSELIIQALNYHGQDFRKALDTEAADIFKNIDMKEVDYLQYLHRAKEFRFQERSHRQRLYKFLSRKAHLLYMSISNLSLPVELDCQSDEIYAVMPPLERYMGIPGHERRKLFYETIKKGDPIIGTVIALQNCGFKITLLCTDGGKRREIHDLGIRCFCSVANSLVHNMHDNAFSSYHVKDLVRGAVLNELESPPSIERLCISMKIEDLAFNFQNKLKMGLITEEDLPIHYRKSTQFKNKSYSEVLESNLNFNNPTNIYQIGESLGLNVHKTESFFKHLHGAKYGNEEYAYALRKLQSAKWAFKRIRDGVTQFKAGNHTEAYQCLNKALHIDPESVEGLVARGALFANNNNLVKAVEDFERALEINPQHGNAQKYLSETLVAIGKCCLEKGDIKGACKNYKKAITINGNEEAKEALASAENSLNSKDTISDIFPSSSNDALLLQTSSPTTNLVDADTRQKLLFLLQDDKEKSFGKKHHMHLSGDKQIFLTSDKTLVHEKEIQHNLKHDDMHLQKPSSSKSNICLRVKSDQQLENIITTGKDQLIKHENLYMGKNKLYSADGNNNSEKKTSYTTDIKVETSRNHLPSVETKIQSKGPISLEERLKEYYKKVGENEFKGSPTKKEFSTQQSHKIVKKSTKYTRELSEPQEIFDNTSSNSCSISNAGDRVRKEAWTEQQPLSKFEYKRHIKMIPFSDHSNSSSCKRLKATSREKGVYMIKKKSYKTVNSENCSEWLSQCLNIKYDKGKNYKRTEWPCEFVTEVNVRSGKLNTSHRELESSFSTSGHNELSFRKLQISNEKGFNRKYSKNNMCRRSACNINHFYNSDKHSYNTSARFGVHSSSNHQRSLYRSNQRSHLRENKNCKNHNYTTHKKYSSVPKTVSMACKVNSSQNLEANHRKDRGVICRALDPERLRQLKESSKLSRGYSIKSKSLKTKHSSSNLKTEENSALEAAMAAAQKITEALKDTISPNEGYDQTEFPVMSAKQRQTLQQMEIFLEKLKSQKKTETFSKHD